VALGASALGLFAWSHIWIYLLAELVAGAAAAGVFLLIEPGEKVAGDVRAVEPDGETAWRVGDGTPRGVARTAS
jgi:aquaporin Z